VIWAYDKITIQFNCGDLLKHSFFLVIPKQQSNPQRLKEFEEKILQQWISELPIANLGLATRLIYDFILEFNTLAMPSQLRFDTLELLRPSLLTIEDYLRSKLINSDFPKDENDQKVLKLLVALQRQFTIGHWIVVKELTEHESRWFKSKNAAISIQRTIKGLGNIIVSHFIMAMRVPDWVWMDVHSLYKLSVKTKKNTIQVVNWDNNSVNKTSSAEDCYLQILMLSLADSSGLMQKEIRQVYRFTETVCPLISLKTAPVTHQAQQCIILTDEDKAPFFQNQSDVTDAIQASSGANAIALYLDFTNLYQALAHKKISINTSQTRFGVRNYLSDTDEAITQELLDYLQQRWSGISLQSDLLFNDRLDRYVAIGLTASSKLQKKQEQISDDQEFFVHSISNQLLSGVFKKNSVLSIGSLISFRKADTPQPKRTLAVVNRLVVEKERGRISFGVQLLTHQFMSVGYLKFGPQAEEHFKNALVYKGEEEKAKNYIIMDTFVFKEDDIIQLFLNQDQFPIILKNKKNIALGYWQFECFRVSKKDISHY